MSAHVIRADSCCLPLPDASVDLIVTSPPYFGLRSYTDNGEHYAGQVGDEDTPTAYLDRLIACTAEWMRVLKPSGSIFVNLGDKYAADNRGSVAAAKRGAAKWSPAGPAGYAGQGYVRQKSLMMLPARYAIRCVDELGLIQRAEIIWSKPNGLPESVTDRVRRSHEQVFHFTKQGRYFSGVDEIREPHTVDIGSRPMSWDERKDVGVTWTPGKGTRGVHTGQAVVDPRKASNPLGKLPGSVWTIPTAPLKVPASLGVDHFAAYPPELVKRIVLGWSPREVCSACGEGRRPVVQSTPVPASVKNPPGRSTGMRDASRGDAAMTCSGQEMSRWKAAHPDSITGYACGCPDTTAPATTGIVLDPFGGTGTSALVASCYGRIGISVDLSHDYSRLAQWRTGSGAERARVLGVEKPAEQCEGQADLFGDAA